MKSRSRFIGWALVIASSIGGPMLHAGEPPPTAYPQWIESFSREYLLYDGLITTDGPVSARMPGGDVVVATGTLGGLLLRRFATDGSVRQTHVEPIDSSGVFLRADAATDSVYLMTATRGYPNVLMRFDSGLQRSWSIGMRSTYFGFDMQVLSDGSAVTLRGTQLMRVARDASVEWVIDDFDDGMPATASAMATAPDDTIWTSVSASYVDRHDDTAVMRFSPQGVRLSADHVVCAACYTGNAIDVDVLEDGSATVVGDTGSSPASFFARYSAAGDRLVWTVPTDAAVTFTRAAHDDGGAIYVSSFYGSPLVRRVDPATAEILWTRDAADFTPLESGVLLTETSASRPDTSGISFVAYDPSGNFRWEHALLGSSFTKKSHGARADQSIDFLVEDPQPTTFACSVYPHIVSFDAKGSISSMPPVCRTSVKRADFREFDAQPTAGVLVNLLYSLAAYTPEGDFRWQVQDCDWCELSEDPNAPWGTAMLAADGSAWATEYVRYSPLLADGEGLIKRFDVNGNEVLSIPAVEQNSFVSRMRLVGSAQDVVVLQPVFNGSLTWQRVRANGIPLPTHTYSIPDYGPFNIDDTRELSDGGIILVTKGEYSCNVGCSPHYVTVLRLNADGSLRWRYQFPESDAAIALAADGGAAAVVWSYPIGLVLRQIDINGHASQVPLSDATLSDPSQLAGPVNGRWLLRARMYPNQALSLIDANGTSLANRVFTSSEPTIHSANELGYVVEIDGVPTNAELLDPNSMATTAVFNFGIADVTGYSGFAWRIFADGTVYAGFASFPEGGDYNVGMARFAVPGSVSSDLLFRSGFD